MLVQDTDLLGRRREGQVASHDNDNYSVGKSNQIYEAARIKLQYVGAKKPGCMKLGASENIISII